MKINASIDINFGCKTFNLLSLKVNNCQRPWALVQHMHQLVFFSLYTSIWTREKRHKRPLVNDSSESSFIDDGNKVGTTWQRDCLNWVSILRRSHKEKNKSLSSNSRAVSWWKKVVYCSLWSSSCRPPSGRRWIVESHQCPSVGHFFFMKAKILSLDRCQSSLALGELDANLIF